MEIFFKHIPFGDIDATNEVSPEKASSQERIFPARNNNQLADTIINRYANPNGIEQIINFKMAVQRIFIEHMFSDVKKSFQIFQAKRQQSVT